MSLSGISLSHHFTMSLSGISLLHHFTMSFTLCQISYYCLSHKVRYLTTSFHNAVVRYLTTASSDNVVRYLTTASSHNVIVRYITTTSLHCFTTNSLSLVTEIHDTIGWLCERVTFNILVILESLYGIWFDFFLGSPSELMTLPSDNRPELMWIDSEKAKYDFDKTRKAK